MLVQNFLRDLKSAYGDWLPGLKFLIMFIGTVFGPLVLSVVGGRDPKTLSETGLAWSFMADRAVAPHWLGGRLLDV